MAGLAGNRHLVARAHQVLAQARRGALSPGDPGRRNHLQNPHRVGRAPVATRKKGRIFTDTPQARGWDLNPRPSGYEPDEIPDFSTPHDAPRWWTAVV